MNLTVADHIAEGREVLVRAAKLSSEGSTLAQREAKALRDAQAMKSEALMGVVDRIREHACPSCGCFTLLPHNGRAFCINRHCAPAGTQRRWDFRDLAFIGPGTPKKVCVTEAERPPRDVMDKNRLLPFFTQTGRPMSGTTLDRLVKLYGLPHWPNPLGRSHLYSLSDVATAHAVHMANKGTGDCTATSQRPPCTGLADLFFTAAEHPTERETAKKLCGACPLKQVCLETAMARSEHYQFGIAGGLTARERRQLLSPSRRRKTSPTP
ncbi:WhiB family transcriptional regulator [Streptomyces mirabilis]|uniref:WhiB family transcriptional regulator n=1 Tax=Streptomyces mirabilis TaxID=68239 RepID=UPI00382E52EB